MYRTLKNWLPPFKQWGGFFPHFVLPGIACLLTSVSGFGQSSANYSQIIRQIEALESRKDPKCYATANRLEDFMFGTPLSDGARNLRIDIQKEVSLYLRELASGMAAKGGQQTIQNTEMVKAIDSVAVVGSLPDGDYFYKVDSVLMRIRKRDFDQYSSVAYGYRSLLAVEQDLIFVEDKQVLPMSEEALVSLNTFLNLSTLASLQVADLLARREDSHWVTSKILTESWIRILGKPGNQDLFAYDYPKVQTVGEGHANEVLREVIDQKIKSYDKYNELSTSIFLRNVQVFFARQKWPTDQKESDALKNYFLESLVSFTETLITRSAQISLSHGDAIVRVSDVQKALQQFLPHEVNLFEDVIFFPLNPVDKITIESYDLDAFRDGGLHWRVLGYALDNEAVSRHIIDPNAAELIVEGIAQLGVLVLRLGGVYSHDQSRIVMHLDDIQYGFESVQHLINGYSSITANANSPEEVDKNRAVRSKKIEGGFEDITEQSGIAFEHRSSDWLNRLIRSYVFSEDSNVAKLSIPPAFGGAGVACEDINNDGLPDLLLLGGVGNRLYLNTLSGKFLDITDKSQVNNWNDDLKSFGEARQPIINDFDNDGLQDILIIYVNDMHRMYRNIDGTRFEDVSTTSGLDGTGAVAGPATVLDYDNDGLLDVFIGYFGNYLDGTLPTLSRNNQNGMPNKLYRNLGNFHFEQVVFTPDSLTDNGWTQAAGHTDINQDGRQDLIVGNDFGVNRYYLNTEDRGFVEMSKEWGTDKPSYTMNVGIGDINKDQYPDLYISNIVVMQKEEKYVSPNEKTTMKFDPEKMTGIRTIEANDLFLSTLEGKTFGHYELSDAVGRGFSSTGWSWDADFFDYDNDGDEDLYCLNGMNDFRVYSSENPFYYSEEGKADNIRYAESDRERNVFFINENGILVNASEALGTDLLSNSRSASYFDYDNDGDLDIVINNYHDKASFLRNNAGSSQNYIKIRLEGDASVGVSRDAIGASIVANSANHEGLWREVHSTTGYLSVHPKEQHFGLGSDQTADIVVKWPNGRKIELKGLDANRSYRIQYPDHIAN